MLKHQFRSNEHDLARDFYRRALSESTELDRAVGFFSSTVLVACAEGFREFFERGGRYRVVCSHILSKKDIERFIRGYRDRPELIREKGLELFSDDPNELFERLDELVPWLVATGRLDLKIALLEEGGISEQYHEKLGLFRDDDENLVAFSGSANESYRALKRNFEVIDVFRSWRDGDSRRARQKRRDFDDLWHNQTEGLEVLSFVQAARRDLLVTGPDEKLDGKAPTSRDLPEDGEQEAIEVEGVQEILQIPSYIRLYDHQKQAVRSWLTSNGRGLLQMATGSGKTITALAAATKLYEMVGGPLFVVIIAPYLHLVDQWVEEARNFGLEPLACARGRDVWYEDFQVRLFNARVGSRPITSVIATTATCRTDAFQDLLQGIDLPMMFIGDEAHNLGASNTRTKLPVDAQYRLGLSATPERWYDERGTDALTDYFGPIMKEAKYTLEEALDDGVLCPYNYYPQTVELTDEELEEYQALTKQIAKALHAGDDLDVPSERLERLLINRARLVASAYNKLSLLRDLMMPYRRSQHNLVYCGDGSVEEPATEDEMRQIRAATRILGHELEMRVATYTAETSTQRRRELRREFARGDIQCLVAIRCLDEGVDIPETRRAFILASSSNPRQFIQRRGRILRRSPNKDRAEIHDFLVVPPEEHRNPGSDFYSATRKMFRRELKRAIEFAKLAENGPEAMGRLLDVRDQLNLLDLGIETDV